jgi:hypothetical protein
MAGKDNFKIVNFRLNLEKKEEKELYDFLQSIDNGNLKSCYGSKSGFIKEILIAHMHGITDVFGRFSGDVGGADAVGGISAFTDDVRKDLKLVVKEAFWECLDKVDKAAFGESVGSASKGKAITMSPDNVSSIPEQADDIPGDAMDYLKELYG